MQDCNHKPDEHKQKTPDISSVFSLTFDKEIEVDSAEFLRNVRRQITEILRKRFPERIRHEIHDKPDRLNFACPYCGDSSSNTWKKRANVYLKGFNYHCFNCNEHHSFDKFLKDFSKNMGGAELQFLKGEQDKHKKETKAVLQPYILFNKEVLETYAIDRTYLIKKMGYTEIRGTKIATYLHKRLQMDFNKFAWHQKYQKLLIFNLTPNGKVMGFQIRNFHAKPKYLTFKLSKIYSEILEREIPITKDFQHADKLSNVFGINELDINKPVTVFEGPFDSFLFNNSAAVCSVKNEFPFHLDVRWLYDFDRAGIEASMKRLQNGETVLLWKKFLRDIDAVINTNKKIDLTDIYVLSIRKKFKLPNIENYFTNDRYDIYWL